MAQGEEEGWPIAFGALRPGDRFYVRGEFWAPREADLPTWPAIREPLREVVEIVDEPGRLEIRTNEPGIRFAYNRQTTVYLADGPPDDFPPHRGTREWPWVAANLRRIIRENRAGIRVDPAAACPTCRGTGLDVKEGGETRICSACRGERVR